MSVVSYAALVSKILSPTQVYGFLKSSTISSGTGWNSAWTAAGFPVTGAAPGAAAIPDRTTTGALGQGNKSGTEQRAFLRRYGVGMNGTINVGSVMLVDRLAHVSGLDATNTGAQAVAFPALTRFTTGTDVFAAIEIYTAIGATGTTITMSYTNDAGTSGQISQPIVFGGASFQNVNKVMPMSMALGDKGVRAVASVTALATTGTVGNFGVTMFKPLGIFPVHTSTPYPNGGPSPQVYLPMPAIPDNACLQLLMFGGGQVNTSLFGEIGFFED